MCDQAYVCEMFDRLHFQKGLKESLSVADYTMIGHKNRFVPWNQRDKTGRYFIGPGGCILCQRHNSKGHDRFLTEHLIESTSSAGESGSDRRMGVNDRCHLISMVIDSKMHIDLTCHFPGTS